MKVHSTVPIENFTPVRLTVTLETQTEVAEFYSLFNNSVIADAMPSIVGELIRGTILEQTHDREGYAEAFDRLLNAISHSRNHHE